MCAFQFIYLVIFSFVPFHRPAASADSAFRAAYRESTSGSRSCGASYPDRHRSNVGLKFPHRAKSRKKVAMPRSSSLSWGFSVVPYTSAVSKNV